MRKGNPFRLAGLLVLLSLAACTRTLPAPVVYRDSPPRSLTPPRSVIAEAPSARPASPPVRTAVRGGVSSSAIRRVEERKSPAGGDYRIITIRPRDTLYGLGRRYGVGAAAIVQANGLRPPYRLVPGQKLRIPRLRRHVVARGETLFAISRRYGTDVYVIARLNGLGEPYRLRPGQVLRLPAAGTAPSSSRQRVAAPPKPSRVAKQGTIRDKPRRKTRPSAGRSAFIWPVRGKVISRFGPKSNGRQNDGINIAIRANEKIRAAAPGTVVYAGNELKGFGNLVLIRHRGGYTSAYAHNARLLVRRGDRIAQGQVIALGGSSGSVTSPQLHFEIRKGRKAINPLIVLQRATARPMS